MFLDLAQYGKSLQKQYRLIFLNNGIFFYTLTGTIIFVM